MHRKYRCSLRRACKALSVSRSILNYRPRPKERERRLVSGMKRIKKRFPRYGYRRVWVMLRRNGWRVNRKCVRRLWRREGLKVPAKRRKPRIQARPPAPVLTATKPNNVWSWDFIFDQTFEGRTLKCLTLLDEFTRESLCIKVERRMGTKEVIDALLNVIAKRGAPTFLRSDNGSEFIAKELKTWLEKTGIQTHYIDPGSPWQNGYEESFHDKFRDECLNRETFLSLKEAKIVIEAWRREYNEVRPHSSLNWQTPKAFAKEFKTGVQGKAKTAPAGRRKANS